MDADQLQKLRALAAAAPTSAWMPDANGPRWAANFASPLDKPAALRLGAYIAAVSPDVVLRLVEDLREARAQLVESANAQAGHFAEIERTLVAERDELAAEVAAYQGRPEGALNEHWRWEGRYWRRTLANRVVLHAHHAGWCAIGSALGVGNVQGPTSGGWLASQRAAESAANDNGWLP